MWSVGLFTFVLNAFFVWAAAAAFGGVEIASFWTALAVAMILTVVNLTVGGMLNVDGDHVWRSKVARRVLKRQGKLEFNEDPGFLFIQIDGLGHDVLADAIESGHAPVLGSAGRRWDALAASLGVRSVIANRCNAGGDPSW